MIGTMNNRNLCMDEACDLFLRRTLRSSKKRHKKALHMLSSGRYRANTDTYSEKLPDFLKQIRETRPCLRAATFKVRKNTEQCRKNKLGEKLN